MGQHMAARAAIITAQVLAIATQNPGRRTAVPADPVTTRNPMAAPANPIMTQSRTDLAVQEVRANLPSIAQVSMNLGVGIDPAPRRQSSAIHAIVETISKSKSALG